MTMFKVSVVEDAFGHYFIEAADAVGVKLDCVWVATSAEDAQVNALHRMWDRYGQVFFDADEIKAHDARHPATEAFLDFHLWVCLHGEEEALGLMRRYDIPDMETNLADLDQCGVLAVRQAAEA